MRSLVSIAFILLDTSLQHRSGQSNPRNSILLMAANKKELRKNVLD